MPYGNIARLYCDSDLFLFSSVHDTQGLVLAEAMAGSTPVVALDGPGQRDIIFNDQNGYITNSAKEMLVRINQIADDPELHAHLQSGAWQTSREYRSDKYIDKTVNFYTSVINQNNQ